MFFIIFSLFCQVVELLPFHFQRTLITSTLDPLNHVTVDDALKLNIDDVRVDDKDVD